MRGFPDKAECSTIGGSYSQRGHSAVAQVQGNTKERRLAGIRTPPPAPSSPRPGYHQPTQRTQLTPQRAHTTASSQVQKTMTNCPHRSQLVAVLHRQLIDEGGDHAAGTTPAGRGRAAGAGQLDGTFRPDTLSSLSTSHAALITSCQEQTSTEMLQLVMEHRSKLGTPLVLLPLLLPLLLQCCYWAFDAKDGGTGGGKVAALAAALPHQGAQKSSRTGTGDLRTSSSKVVSFTAPAPAHTYTGSQPDSSQPVRTSELGGDRRGGLYWPKGREHTGVS